MIGKTLKLREDLTLVAIEEQAVLLDVDKRRYFDGNDTASFLLQLMENGCPYDNLMVRLVSDFDVVHETARLDVDNFVVELLRLGLVEVGAATANEIVREPMGKRKPYQAPQFEQQAEIALVAGAVGPVTDK